MSSTWFRRMTKGIQTDTKEKKEAPEGIWHKCPECKTTVTSTALKENLYVCAECNFHNRINAIEYFQILFDNGEYKELFENIVPKDFLEFVDVKPYGDRLKSAQKSTGLKDAMTVGVGKVEGYELVIADYAIKHKLPFMIISKSGGARMMESAFSLMQMAKTSAKLTQLAAAKLPYISLMTDPTTGGVTASFAMLGDINIAEPKALIGFAGPRIVKETIKKDLPSGFQRSEFLQEHGFLDFVVDRKVLKSKIADAIAWFGKK
jgi:acetyl-CoA carboxylase carboxyl transferase subunit beta